MIDPHHLNAILTSAQRAPSGDNLQPWMFELKGDDLSLVLKSNFETDPFSVMCDVDEPSLIAIGAVLENIIIASRQFGYEAHIQIFPDGPSSPRAAQIHFTANPAKDQPLYPYIMTRCVNREAYQNKPLEQTARDQIVAAARSEDQSSELVLAEQSRKKNHAAFAASLTDRLIFEIPRFHQFLFDNIRWTRQQVESTRDGLDYRNLGLMPGQDMIFRTLKSWPLVRTLNHLGLSRFIPFHSASVCRGSSAIGLLRIQGQSAADIVRGGQALQRLWLTAAANGVSMQPMTGIIWIVKLLLNPRGFTLTNSQKRALNEAEKALNVAFPPSSRNTRIMLFRMGYCAKPIVPTLRYEISHVLRSV